MNNSEKHPYETFPFRLEYGKAKSKVIAHFNCLEELKKHVERYKLKESDCILSHRNGDAVMLTKPKKPRKSSKPKPSKKPIKPKPAKKPIKAKPAKKVK